MILTDSPRLGNRLFYRVLFGTTKDTPSGSIAGFGDEPRTLCTKAEANVVGSRCERKSNDEPVLHQPVLDFDWVTPQRAVRAVVDILGLDNSDNIDVVASTTTGHFHLYVNVPMPWPALAHLLTCLTQDNLIEPGYVAASIAREQTFVRLPHVRKSASESATYSIPDAPD
jgi:hypothetical protein